ncbi:MAG: hypothetical protein IPH75_13890 [bacterium]|nr:hypothetical protein [bacterium]
MKQMLPIFALLLLIGAAVTPTGAQDHQPPLAPPGHGMGHDDSTDPLSGEPPVPFDAPMSDKRGRQFQQFRMQKMIEMLDLDENQQKIMRDLFDNEMKELQAIERESRTLTDQLVPLVKKKTRDEKQISLILSQLDDLDTRRDQLRLKFKAEADKSLTVVQRAKLRIFLQRFERQMIQKVRGMPGRPGPRGPMTPPHNDDDSEDN